MDDKVRVRVGGHVAESGSVELKRERYVTFPAGRHEAPGLEAEELIAQRESNGAAVANCWANVALDEQSCAGSPLNKRD